MATMALSMPWPRAAMKAMARRIDGMASIMSMTRMMMVSTTPPLYPAMAPSVTPMESEIATESRPTVSEIWLPTRMRHRMSRPCWSVPNQCSGLGPWKETERSCWYGSYGSTCGATKVTIATRARPTMIARLTMAGTFLLSEYQTSFHSDSVFSAAAPLWSAWGPCGAWTVASAMPITPLPCRR